MQAVHIRMLWSVISVQRGARLTRNTESNFLYIRFLRIREPLCILVFFSGLVVLAFCHDPPAFNILFHLLHQAL